MKKRKGVSRRKFLAVTGAAAAATLPLVGGLVGKRRAPARPASGRASGGAGAGRAADGRVDAYFGELKAGGRIAQWTLVSVGGIEAGAIAVEMATAQGERFVVELLRRDPALPGVAETAQVGLYLRNFGAGRRRSVEEHGLGAMALAQALAAREAAGAPVPPLVRLRDRRVRPSRG